MNGQNELFVASKNEISVRISVCCMCMYLRNMRFFDLRIFDKVRRLISFF